MEQPVPLSRAARDRWTDRIVGVGVGFRPELAADLLSAPGTVDFVEVVAETCFASPAARREAAAIARIWPVVLSGVLYILFGVALLFAPMLGALVMVTIGGVLAIIFAIGLFALAWRIYQSAKSAA